MDLPPDYQAALDRAFFYPLSNSSLLRLSGPDRQAFVQRQTTNNLNLLSPGRVQTTVLTSALGRILDVFLAFLEGSGEEETLVLLPLPGRGASTLRYLKSRIFIMDKVSISDQSHEYAHYLLDGPQAAAVLEALNLALPENGAFSQAVLEGHPILLIGAGGFTGSGIRLLVPPAAAPSFEEVLAQAGSVRISPALFDLLRIEAGQPAAGQELREDYTPLETGLAGCVAENKGCYTGQEVLTRQVSYDKVTRQLTGLRLESLLAPGSKVFHAGQSVGEITSAALSPRFGAVALAILKRPHFEPGTALLAGSGEHSVTAITNPLPFR